MKKFFFILVFLFSIAFLKSVTPSINFSVKTYYDSNIIKLSDESRDEFLNNFNSKKYNISSVDDWVNQLGVTIKIKNKFPKKHTQIYKFSFNAFTFYNNPIKSNINMLLSYNQFVSRMFGFYLSYSYYPKIYLRRYKSEFDQQEDYHDFTYSKNVYSFYINFSPFKKISIKPGIIFSQLYYNKYFTEYDTNDMENYIKLTFKCKELYRFFIRYGYKISSQINKNQENAIKNPEAEYNNYELGLNLYYLSFSNLIKFKYKEKYFSSSNSEDVYHYHRNDRVFNIYNSISYELSSKYKFSLWGEFEKRKSDSPFENVEKDKSYSLYKIGLTLKFFISNYFIK